VVTVVGPAGVVSVLGAAVVEVGAAVVGAAVVSVDGAAVVGAAVGVGASVVSGGGAVEVVDDSSG
jgi:hypothetical protein